MSLADYNQEAEDHQALLVLVKGIGSLRDSAVPDKLFERISSLHQVWYYYYLHSSV